SGYEVASLISVAVYFMIFAVASHLHNKINMSIKELELWIKIKSMHLARLMLDWQNIPSLSYLPNELDIKGTDLDLVGNESLLRVINTSTSLNAKLLLKEWLYAKINNLDEIIERQEIIKELIPMTIFRDKLTLISMLSSKLEFDGKWLNTLLNNSEVSQKKLKSILIFLIALSLINVLLITLNIINIFPAYWSISILFYLYVFSYINKRKGKIFDNAEYISDELRKLEGIFKFIENFNYKKHSKLASLLAPLMINKLKPSFILNKVRNIVEVLRIQRKNPYIWYILVIIFPLDNYFEFRLNNYKILLKEKINIWLDTWYKLEALSSLANFAFLNPGYNFPQIIDNHDSGITFNAKQLGHPLIKVENKICNDFSLTPAGEIALITGSNMSGKSTFVRSLGINLSLAYAGSVVNADKLEVSIFNLFTCIRINDSITDGISFFYAEVKRLKALLTEIESSKYPVFFLIDEIFRGTNNIERLKGSSMLIKNLAETNAAGAIATHDLELVKLSEKIPKLKNYHFIENIKDDRMFFNYKLNEGPCLTTNALKIMKIAGLPVDN
ncbi:MAG: hypothetical protein P8Z35_11015, partial [Ignavibacteriaceae bacterium]